MKVIARYSHKGADSLFEQEPYAGLLAEVVQAIEETDAEQCRSKTSKETTMEGKLLYSPVEMNKALKGKLYPLGWAIASRKNKRSEEVTYSEPRVHLTTTVRETGQTHEGYRAMDGIKNRVGLEIQFGKYAFMGYDILAKMVIFHNMGHIDAGIEVVPMKSLSTGGGRAALDASEMGATISDDESDPGDVQGPVETSRMSTGVSYFEQIKADLETRRVADLDIPVLILGIDV